MAFTRTPWKYKFPTWQISQQGTHQSQLGLQPSIPCTIKEPHESSVQGSVIKSHYHHQGNFFLNFLIKNYITLKMALWTPDLFFIKSKNKSAQNNVKEQFQCSSKSTLIKIQPGFSFKGRLKEKVEFCMKAKNFLVFLAKIISMPPSHNYII